MDSDDDPLDLLDDDDDGIIEMGLFLDEDSDKQNSQKTPQRTGCSVVLLCLGVGVMSAGVFLVKMIA